MTVVGTPTYEAGQDPYFGNALRLPGGSGLFIEYDTAATALSLAGGTSYTVSFQFLVKQLGASGAHSDRVFATDNGTGAGLNAWGMRIDNSPGNHRFHWRHGNSEHLIGESLEADRWYNVVAVYDADTGWLRLFLDGVVNNAIPPASVPVITQAMNLRLANYQAGGAQGANGLLDELRIYDRALSFERDDNNNVIGGEIAQLFAVPEPGSVVLMGMGAMLMLSRRALAADR